LWLYNLHYFDDLNARESDSRRDWHSALIRRWVEENPPARGVGWEPYPLSLRIVNWIKWSLGGGELAEEAIGSLAVQARYLMENLETHLLGNHLFANAKALVFAGGFFQGKEARGWLRKGVEILRRETGEQILGDGGHFERSPMYHSLILEDLLDLLNLDRAYCGLVGNEDVRMPADWEVGANRMRRWLSAMCHPDGEIALFNDAAQGIAPTPAELEAYAVRLDLGAGASPADGLTHLAESGYVRFQERDVVLLADVAELGPDYLPGHGHADTLSFELSLHGRRVVVDCGISRYDSGPDRSFERGTKAHNTVAVDDADSSEVWGSFRVARRGRPFGLCMQSTKGETTISCSHDGYRRLPGRVVHRRTWAVGRGLLRVEDRLEGSHRLAQSRFLFHPSVAEASGEECLPGFGRRCGKLAFGEGRMLRWRLEQGEGRFEPATYHPGFGVRQDTVRLVADVREGRCALELSWD
jgi:uncharacterized heparinase superfamily protein